MMTALVQLQMIVAVYVLVVTPDMKLTVIRIVTVTVLVVLQMIVAAYVLVVCLDMKLTVI